MDWNLRAVPLNHDIPWWMKVLPLVFVALIAYGVATGEPAERERSGDASSQVRPN